MHPTPRKPMRTLEGAIGKKPCEIKLQAILQELGDRVAVNKVFGTLLDFREGLKQIGYMPDKKWRGRCWIELKERTAQRFTKLYKTYGWPEILYTHALCCMTAYFRETWNNDK